MGLKKFVNARGNYLDELAILLSIHRDHYDDDLVHCLRNIAIMHRKLDDVPMALHCLQQAIALLELAPYRLEDLIFLRAEKGALLYQAGYYHDAFNELTQALATGLLQPTEQAVCLYNIGACLHRLGDNIAAGNNYILAQQIFNSLQDYKNAALMEKEAAKVRALPNLEIKVVPQRLPSPRISVTLLETVDQHGQCAPQKE